MIGEFYKILNFKNNLVRLNTQFAHIINNIMYTTNGNMLTVTPTAVLFQNNENLNELNNKSLDAETLKLLNKRGIKDVVINNDSLDIVFKNETINKKFASVRLGDSKIWKTTNGVEYEQLDYNTVLTKCHGTKQNKIAEVGINGEYLQLAQNCMWGSYTSNTGVKLEFKDVFIIVRPVLDLSDILPESKDEYTILMPIRI